MTADMPRGGSCRYFTAMPVRIGIVCDPIFYDSIFSAADFVPIRFAHWEEDISSCDLILIVSSWHGLHDDWGGMAASGGERRAVLIKLMDRCRSRGIPVVFLSKEDPPSYRQFVEYAKHADFVFTSAAEKIGDYCRACGHDRVYPFRFCINPGVQNPVGSRPSEKNRAVLFAGTWYRKFPERCKDLGMLLDGAIKSVRGLTIIDRMAGVPNGERFRFPEQYERYLQPAVSHAQLREVYRI